MKNLCCYCVVVFVTASVTFINVVVFITIIAVVVVAAVAVFCC